MNHPSPLVCAIGIVMLCLPAVVTAQPAALAPEAPVTGVADAAEDAQGLRDEIEDHSTTRALSRAFSERLTIWQRPDGRRVYASHCRMARDGCPARISAYARLITGLAREFDVDPFLVGAIVVRESGLNPFAEGTAGERGIVQLHPGGVGHRVRFVRNDAYRRRCRRATDGCQAEVLREGVQLIANSMRRCGDVEQALGMYNSGRCRVTGYSRRVLAERTRLIELAKGVTSRGATR